MKKKLAIILGLSFCVYAIVAQIPNNGFENWTTVGSYSIPNDWGTMNHTTATSGVFTAEKGTPGSPGASYLKLTSKTIGANVMNGVAVSGVLDTVTMQPKSGFAYNQRSASLKGKWQHMIYGSSQGSINVLLTRWDTGTNSRVTVASANYTLTGMAMSWATFTVPLTYLDGGNPDSCIIFLKASGSTPTNNDYLWVENLMFNGVVAGLTDIESSINSIKVYPNPSFEKLNLVLELKSSQTIKMQIVDVKGDVVSAEEFEAIEGTNEYSVNVNTISRGSYILKLTSKTGTVSRNIIIDVD